MFERLPPSWWVVLEDGSALLEDVSHVGSALRDPAHTLFPVRSLCFVPVAVDEFSPIPAPVAGCHTVPAIIGSYLPEALRQFFLP